ncbi:MAG: hypothetical protein R2749_14610 [Acidimicrobiales bacterium]
MSAGTVALRRTPEATPRATSRSPRFALGFVDVAGSSLASFSLGIYATRALDAELLGVYALFFTGFLLGAVVPAQLLCVPAELEAVRGPLSGQFRGLRSLAPWVLAAGAATAVLTVALIALTVGTSRPGFWPLALTMVPTAALSPLQDHIRRLCHQAHRSNIAAGMSAVQATVTLIGLVLLGTGGGGRALAPFGALFLANVASSTLGFTQLRRERLALTGRHLDAGELMRTGRWLTGAGTAQAAGGLGSLLLVSRLAGVTAAGLCEAVRVLSQPVYVVSTALLAVLNPVLFRAHLSGDHEGGRRARRQYGLVLTAVSAVLLLASTRVNPLNPLPGWFPAAYEEPWLLEVVIISQLLFHLPLSTVSSLLGRRRVKPAALGQIAGFPPQLLLASTAGIAGAWAYAFGFIGAAATRIVAIGSLQQRDRTAEAAGGGAAAPRALRRPRKGSDMTDPHPIEEPSVIGAALRHPLVVGLSVVGGLLLGGAGAVAAGDRYEASTELTVQDPRLTALFQGSPNLDAKRYVADQVDLLQSPEVLRAAASRLSGSRWGEITMDDVADGLAVRSSDASNTFTVAFGDADEAFAAAADEAVVVAYIDAAEAVTRTEFDNTINALEDQIDELDTKVATLDREIASYQDAGATMVDARLDAAIATRARLYDERTSLSIRMREVTIDLARNPSGVTRRSTTYTESAAGGALRFVLLGGFVGGLAGTAAAYVKARRRRTFESASEPERLLGLRYLATIPAHGRGTPTAAVVRQRESVLEFLATVVEGEARRREISRFGFVSPSSSRELAPLGGALQHMLAGTAAEHDEPAAATPALTIDLRDGRDGLDGEVRTANGAAGVNGSHGTAPAGEVRNGSVQNGSSAGYDRHDPAPSVQGAASGRSATATATRWSGGGVDRSGEGDGDGGPPDDVELTEPLLDGVEPDGVGLDDAMADDEALDGPAGLDDQHGPFDGTDLDWLDLDLDLDGDRDPSTGLGVAADEDARSEGPAVAPARGDDDGAAGGIRPTASYGNGNGSMTQRSEPGGTGAGGSGGAGEGDTLVLVECPQYARDDADGNQIDAIVVVIDHHESIAATAEVARRVQVLGWDLLGYVYVTDRNAG